MMRQYWWVLLVFLFVINVTVIALRVMRQTSNPVPEEQLDLHRGAVAQRDRIDDFTAKVGAFSLDDLESSLSTSELTVSVPGVGPGPADGNNQFPSVLSDRRAARLFTEYKSLKEGAKQRVEKLAERWLKEHTDRIGQVVAVWKESAAIEMGIDLRGSNHGCAVSAFLLCEFSDRAAVLDFVKRWDEVGQEGMRNINARAPGLHPIEVVAVPGDLYAFNLCLLLAQRKLKPPEFASRVDREIGVPNGLLTVAPFSEWNAHTNAFDFTHVNKGVPLDAERVIANYAYLNAFEVVAADTKEAQVGLRQRAEKLASSLSDS